MAADVTPTTWLGAGYTNGSNTLVLNTSNNATPALSEASNTDANASTGDIRQVLFALLDKLYNHYISLDSASRPAKMTMTRTTNEDGSGNVQKTFFVSFNIQSTNSVVSPEV